MDSPINPSNVGQKWTDNEENILLEELNKNVDIKTIAKNHNRNIGGINARRKKIAYEMYLKHVSIEEIIEKTKLDNECIRQTIAKSQNDNLPKITENKPSISIESEIVELKNNIEELKNTIKELVKIIKVAYEIEDI